MITLKHRKLWKFQIPGRQHKPTLSICCHQISETVTCKRTVADSQIPWYVANLAHLGCLYSLGCTTDPSIETICNSLPGHWWIPREIILCIISSMPRTWKVIWCLRSMDQILISFARRLLIWKEAMEKKGLRVNAGKTKVMICGTGLDLLQSSGEYPAVCRTGVGNNSIYCNGCKLWVHKKCSGLQRLTPNPDYRCAQCMGNARPIDGRP